MNNILAIAQKEIKAYFASPIAFVVIGVFAFLFGWFFISLLYIFVRESMQASPQFGGPGAMNVNQQMIRYLLQNSAWSSSSCCR
jgi:ABC-2 type transport system permease protein